MSILKWRKHPGADKPPIEDVGDRMLELSRQAREEAMSADLKVPGPDCYMDGDIRIPSTKGERYIHPPYWVICEVGVEGVRAYPVGVSRASVLFETMGRAQKHMMELGYPWRVEEDPETIDKMVGLFGLLGYVPDKIGPYELMLLEHEKRLKTIEKRGAMMEDAWGKKIMERMLELTENTPDLSIEAEVEELNERLTKIEERHD